jgi:hypothetical protein
MARANLVSYPRQERFRAPGYSRNPVSVAVIAARMTSDPEPPDESTRGSSCVTSGGRKRSSHGSISVIGARCASERTSEQVSWEKCERSVGAVGHCRKKCTKSEERAEKVGILFRQGGSAQKSGHRWKRGRMRTMEAQVIANSSSRRVHIVSRETLPELVSCLDGVEEEGAGVLLTGEISWGIVVEFY